MKFYSSFLQTALQTQISLVAFSSLFWAALLIFSNGENTCSVGKACASTLQGDMSQTKRNLHSHHAVTMFSILVVPRSCVPVSIPCVAKARVLAAENTKV